MEEPMTPEAADLYPGTGAMGTAISARTAQTIMRIERIVND